jgi:hypothetical protein
MTLPDAPVMLSTMKMKLEACARLRHPDLIPDFV